jgi:hypothetical protein
MSDLDQFQHFALGIDALLSRVEQQLSEREQARLRVAIELRDDDWEEIARGTGVMPYAERLVALLRDAEAELPPGDAERLADRIIERLPG